jgi:hypothetical protein
MIARGRIRVNSKGAEDMSKSRRSAGSALSFFTDYEKQDFTMKNQFSERSCFVYFGAGLIDDRMYD